jgi:putative DNA primase/helicase
MEDIIAQAGITISGPGPHYTIRCPFPTKHAHDDKKPSASVNLRKGAWRCHACGAQGGAKQLAEALGVAWQAVFRRHFGKPSAVRPADEVSEVADWLRAVRGLAVSEIAMIYAAQTLAGPAVVFDYGKYKKFRPIKGKSFWREPAGAATVLYGLEHLDRKAKIAVLVEGELDLHAMRTLGFANVVSLPDGEGSRITPELMAPLGKILTWLVLTDADAAGDELARRVANIAGDHVCLRAVLSDGGKVMKDPNDALRAGWGKDRFEAAFASAQPIRKAARKAEGASVPEEPAAAEVRKEPRRTEAASQALVLSPTPGPHSDWDTRFREQQSTFPANPREYQLTDLGNARLFAGVFAQDLRYTPSFGWLVWDGKRWSRDELGSVFVRAKEITDRLIQWAWSIRDFNEQKAVMAHALRSQSSRAIKAMVELAQSETHLAVASSSFDLDRWLFNCLNGTIDLRTGQLREHRREDLLTKIAGCKFDPSAPCFRWERFLDKVFGGDLELIGFVQRAAGYTLTGSTREHVLFLLFGTGANGKTTLLEIIRAVLGDYGMQADFNTFLEHRQDGPRNDLARLKGARMVTAVEAEAGRALAEAVVKQATGGDTITARFLYHELFEFVPEFKLFLGTNHKPVIKGSDYGIWRRIRLLPFGVTIPPEERDQDLVEKLKAELSGILAWIVRGCRAWQQGGLREPKAVLAATETYRTEMDILGDFLAACCVQRVNASVFADELYTRYKNWCEDNGERASSQRNLGMRLSERGFNKKKSNGLNVWLGIELAPDSSSEGGPSGAEGGGPDEKPADDVSRAGEHREEGEEGPENPAGAPLGGVSHPSSPSSLCSPAAASDAPAGETLPELTASTDQDRQREATHGVAFRGDQIVLPAFWVITKAEDLPTVAAAISRMPLVPLDIETTGLDPFHHRPRLIQLGLPDGGVAVVDLFFTGGIGSLTDALKNAHILGHNLQFEIAFLQHHYGVQVAGVWDTMVAAKLLGGGQDLHVKDVYSLAGVCRRHLGVKLCKDQQKSNWESDLTPAQIEYAVRDVAVLPPLRDKLALAMTKAKLDRVASLEFDIVPVAAAMELAGVGIDRAAWTGLVNRREAEAETLRELCSKALGVEDPDSWVQVLEALHRLGIRAKRTNEKALAPFCTRPEVRALLDYRHAVGFGRNIGKGITRALDLHKDKDGRVHADFDPLAAPTGRFGCRKPPLLSMPKEAAVRETVVPPAGHLFVSADYSAIDLRAGAQMTKDPGLLKIFKEGGDPHRRTAAAMLGIAESQVTKEARKRAKPPNFGFLFGMGAERFVEYALADYGLEFTLAEAERFKRVYLQTYPGVARWQREMGMRMPIEVRTASGRTQRFKDRKDGYCQRLNTPIQGTAADGMKAALVLLHRRLPLLGARLVLCVHDEVLVETPIEHAEAVKKVVVDSMIEGMQVFVTAVPIVVEASIRRTWAETTD